MKPAILSALTAAALSLVPFTAVRSQEADCPNFWYNPSTGKPECLGSASSTPTPNSVPSPTRTSAQTRASIDLHSEQIYERLSIGISYREVVRNVGQPSHKQTVGQSCQWQQDNIEATFIGGKLQSGSFPNNNFPEDFASARQRFGEPLRCESMTRYQWKWKQGSYQCGIGVDIQQDRVTSKAKICWDDADISASEAAEMGF